MISIIDDAKDITFKKLSFGDWFRFDGDIFMKTESVHLKESPRNCINVKDGKTGFISDSTKVEKIPSGTTFEIL